jgi:hypothetical protein
MTDERALTWTNLFPADVGYMCVGVPMEFEELLCLAGFRRDEDILCAWAPTAGELGRIDIDRFRALALINPRQVPIRSVWARGFSYVRRYAVVPGLADARWFIPRDNVSVAAAALRMYAAYRIAARLLRVGAQLATRLRLPFWYGDKLVIASREPFPLERALAEPFEEANIRLAFSSGTAGPARKPLIQILRPSGDILGYAKLGINQTTHRLVRNEGKILRSLNEDPRAASAVPKLLLEDEVCGRPVAVQSPLCGRPGPIESTSVHDRFLASLQGQQCRPVTASQLFGNIERRVAVLADRPPILRIALDGVRPILERLSMPSTIVHGDFAPWNLRIQGRQVRAFDWEYGELDGIPLVDDLHHALQAGFLLRGWALERALTYLGSVQAANRLSLRAEEIAAIEVLYLVDVCSRRLEEGHSLSEAANRRYLWLISALTAISTAERVR